MPPVVYDLKGRADGGFTNVAKTMGDLRNDPYCEVVRVMQKQTPRPRRVPTHVEEDAFVLEAVESRPRPAKQLTPAY